MASVGAVAMGHHLVLGSLGVQLQLGHLSLELLNDGIIQTWFTGQELQ